MRGKVRWAHLRSVLRAILLAGSALFLIVYLAIVAARIAYPFELEWMEGASLQQVQRILSGQSLYVAPNLDFIPLVYPPLYYHLSALMAALIGGTFLPLRLVSFLASLSSCAVIYLLIRRESENTFAALLGSGLFIATFRLSEAWFDLARIDSLFLFFLLAAIYLARFYPTRRGQLAAGAALALAFITKQTAFFVALPIMAGVLILHRRAALHLVGSAALLMLASTATLETLHRGWYLYYTVYLPRQHTMATRMLMGFWTRDIAAPFWPTALLAILYIIGNLLRERRARVALFYLVVAAGMVGVSWAGRLNRGGFKNALLPAYALLCILFGLALAYVLAHLKKQTARERVAELAIYALCVAQFLLLVYNPIRQIPTAQDRAAGWELVQTIRSLPGDVLIPYHPYLLTLAGKPAHAHWTGMEELIGLYGGGETPEGTRLLGELRDAIANRRYSALFLDEAWDVASSYVNQGPLFAQEDVFWPVTGWRTRPQYIYRPREE